MNVSIPIANTMEYLKIENVSPLISKVRIKVCYVGQEPNRNGSVITKEVATKLGQNLQGTPIVGFYNETTQDFEGHNREVVVNNGKFKIIDMTKPYGFVDTNAKVWFEKFMDGDIEHEYLCTEGYIWTGIYEESQRVVDKGNNQSMELNEKYEKGFWTKDSNSGKNIFIISDGLIEKLCILGSEVEPCFEGSQITSFSLTRPEFTEFKATLFSMINELKDALSKGGSETTMENEKNTQVNEETTPATDFEKKKDGEEQKEEKKGGNPEETKEEKKNNDNEDEKKKKKEEDYACGGGSGGSDEKKKKEKNYELSDIAEYVALQLQYSELQSKYEALEREHQTLTEEATELRSFKLAANRKEKEAMVASFYMLSDEDKKDVVDHLDTYSLDDIEAKLSIICVRNKVNFNSLEEENKSTQQYMFNLQNESNDDDDAPAWVKSVRQHSN